MSAPNPHEELARARKVAAYVAHFDRWITDAGHSPHQEATGGADALEHMKLPLRVQQWAACEQRKASETTWTAIVSVYRARARK